MADERTHFTSVTLSQYVFETDASQGVINFYDFTHFPAYCTSSISTCSPLNLCSYCCLYSRAGKPYLLPFLLFMH